MFWIVLIIVSILLGKYIFPDKNIAFIIGAGLLCAFIGGALASSLTWAIAMLFKLILAIIVVFVILMAGKKFI